MTSATAETAETANTNDMVAQELTGILSYLCEGDSTDPLRLVRLFLEAYDQSLPLAPSRYLQAHGKLDQRTADQAIVSLGEEDTEGRASITEAEAELLREAVTSMLDDADDAAVAFQITNGDHRVPSDPMDPMGPMDPMDPMDPMIYTTTKYRAVAAEHGPGVCAAPSRLISVPRASTDRRAGSSYRRPDSAIAKKKKRPEAAKSSSRVTKPTKASRGAVAKEAEEAAEAAERSKATVLGELMRLETCTYQQVQLAREFLDRFGCAGALTIGELRSRAGLDNGASRALLEMQLSRHGRSKEAIEALVGFLSSIGIVIDMAAAMRESDQRASAFIASRFPTGAQQCQDLLMALLSYVTCVGGGFVESEEDLAAAHEAGYIARALKEMIFIGSFIQRSTTPESLMAAVLAVIGATDASRPIQDPSEHESPEVIVIED
jgi:hypothetical protein